MAQKIPVTYKVPPQLVVLAYHEQTGIYLKRAVTDVAYAQGNLAAAATLDILPASASSKYVVVWYSISIDVAGRVTIGNGPAPKIGHRLPANGNVFIEVPVPGLLLNINQPVRITNAGAAAFNYDITVGYTSDRGQ